MKDDHESNEWNVCYFWFHRIVQLSSPLFLEEKENAREKKGSKAKESMCLREMSLELKWLFKVNLNRRTGLDFCIKEKIN